MQYRQHSCYMLMSKLPGVSNSNDQIGGDLNIFMNQCHQSPLQRVASQISKSAMYIVPTGGSAFMLSQIKSAAHGRTWVFQKAYR